jgi:phosphopantothenoylcysteine decarboxylase/phosphopantothenate--cysteine ligase
MDLDMYRHPTTQKNIKTLQSFGYHLIEPTEGELASGLKGFGRLEEPEIIFSILKEALSPDSPLKGKKVLVSAGPTYEPIDPVRFIGNRSSGLMGIELAKAFADKGAEVTLVLGPSKYEVDYPLVKVIRVETAEEMHGQVTSLFEESDITVMAAAVADFTPEKSHEEKIKKEEGMDNIRLTPTKDILKELGAKKKNHQVLIGFALETENETVNARKKLQTKNLDMIVLNSLKDEGAGFEHKTNKVTLLTPDEEFEISLKLKSEIAKDIVTYTETNLIAT